MFLREWKEDVAIFAIGHGPFIPTLVVNNNKKAKKSFLNDIINSYFVTQINCNNYSRRCNTKICWNSNSKLMEFYFWCLWNPSDLEEILAFVVATNNKLENIFCLRLLNLSSSVLSQDLFFSPNTKNCFSPMPGSLTLSLIKGSSSMYYTDEKEEKVKKTFRLNCNILSKYFLRVI